MDWGGGRIVVYPVSPYRGKIYYVFRGFRFLDYDFRDKDFHHFVPQSVPDTSDHTLSRTLPSGSHRSPSVPVATSTTRLRRGRTPTVGRTAQTNACLSTNQLFASHASRPMGDRGSRTSRRCTSRTRDRLPTLTTPDKG